jgi:ABC-type multidrug transport system ATPase subunit
MEIPSCRPTQIVRDRLHGLSLPLIVHQFQCFCLQIGLMRGGRLLAEQSPEQLLKTYSCDNLEDEQSRHIEDAIQAEAAAHAIPIVSFNYEKSQR